VKLCRSIPIEKFDRASDQLTNRATGFIAVDFRLDMDMDREEDNLHEKAAAKAHQR